MSHVPRWQMFLFAGSAAFGYRGGRYGLMAGLVSAAVAWASYYLTRGA